MSRSIHAIDHEEAMPVHAMPLAAENLRRVGCRVRGTDGDPRGTGPAYVFF